MEWMVRYWTVSSSQPEANILEYRQSLVLADEREACFSVEIISSFYTVINKIWKGYSACAATLTVVVCCKKGAHHASTTFHRRAATISCIFRRIGDE
jgi:hypothetical protein